MKEHTVFANITRSDIMYYDVNRLQLRNSDAIGVLLCNLFQDGGKDCSKQAGSLHDKVFSEN